MKLIKPNWEHSNLNISATLAEFLGAPNKNATLPIIKSELEKGYKNVVFICFDGLGINPMKINLCRDNILWQNHKDTLTSTFPSTTTNATTSLMTNQLPSEHGWFGWSMNFEKLNKNINIFLNTNSWNDEPVDIKETPLGELNYYFDNANTDYNINTVFPPYVKVKNEYRNNTFTEMYEFFNYIKEICTREDKQFIYAYYPDPDSTMHRFGVSSTEANLVINQIAENVEKLYKETKDTLFIITADHGQVDITENIKLYEDKEIMDMLEIYPYLEARATCFKVKKNRKEEFEKVFTAKYGKDFELFKTEDLIKENYFGQHGDKEKLLGDYIAIGTFTHKMFVLTPASSMFKGHHTSLTEEMEVPLIMLNN